MSATDPSIAAGSGDPTQEPDSPFTGNWLAIPTEIDELVGLTFTDALPHLDAASEALADTDPAGYHYKAAKLAVVAAVAVNHLDALCVADIGVDKGGPILSLADGPINNSPDTLSQQPRRGNISRTLGALLELRVEFSERTRAYQAAMSRPKASRVREPLMHSWIDEASQIGLSTRRLPLGGIQAVLRRGNRSGQLLRDGDLAITISSNSQPTGPRQRTRAQLFIGLEWLIDRSLGYSLDRSEWRLGSLDPSEPMRATLDAQHSRLLDRQIVPESYRFRISKNGGAREDTR